MLTRTQCHLAHATAEHFTLHLSGAGEPYALDYFVGPVPHDGACPRRKSRKAGASAGSSPAQFRPIANTTVALRSPTFPPLCVLAPFPLLFLPLPFFSSRFPFLSYSAAAFPASSLRGGAYCRRFPPVSPRVLQRDSLRAVLILVFLAHAAATRPTARLSAFRHP